MHRRIFEKFTLLVADLREDAAEALPLFLPLVQKAVDPRVGVEEALDIGPLFPNLLDEVADFSLRLFRPADQRNYLDHKAETSLVLVDAQSGVIDPIREEVCQVIWIENFGSRAPAVG